VLTLLTETVTNLLLAERANPNTGCRTRITVR
jgi:hypothetical protein